MKEIKFFYMPGCPHCRKAEQLLAELLAAHPEWKSLLITRIDETANPAYAEQFDYYYVPTFYVGEQKLHEGVPTKQAIESVLKAAAE